MAKNNDNPIESVKEYYGDVLKSTKDLKTSACCVNGAPPARIRAILKDIHPEVLDKFYGCGSPIPPALEGKTVLDLGSGTGRDCFILSQIDTANKHLDFHTKQWGYARPNVVFRQGYIEDLESVGIKNESVDIVISNCVLNLSPNKERVFAEIFRVLKPGGELYFSDVFADRRIPKELTTDPLLLGECLSGALYIEDFRRILSRLGCHDYRTLSKSQIAISDSEVEHKIGMINFNSITIRAFKLDLEDRCEDYGQVAYYKGSIDECPNIFTLDDHHIFTKDQPMLICKNTASMLSQTRFAKHFKIIGEANKHFGPFNCEMNGVSKVANMALSPCC